MMLLVSDQSSLCLPLLPVMHRPESISWLHLGSCISNAAYAISKIDSRRMCLCTYHHQWWTSERLVCSLLSSGDSCDVCVSSTALQTIVALPGDEQRYRDKLLAAEAKAKAAAQARLGKHSKANRKDSDSADDDGSDGASSNADAVVSDTSPDGQTGAADTGSSNPVPSPDTVEVKDDAQSEVAPSTIASDQGMLSALTPTGAKYSPFSLVGHTPNRAVWFRVRAVPLPLEVTRIIFDHQPLLRRLHGHNVHVAQLRMAAGAALAASAALDSHESDAKTHSSVASISNAHVTATDDSAVTSAAAVSTGQLSAVEASKLTTELGAFVQQLRDAFAKAGDTWSPSDVSKYVSMR